jgi:GH15 family glucan-1,4-alpha-glucosidase
MAIRVSWPRWTRWKSALCDGPYMRRYEAPDDFGKPETAFNICTFWRIDALARIGRKAQAREIFETMLAARNPLGLLSEDTHPSRARCGATFRRPIRWWASSTQPSGYPPRGTQ